MSNILFTDSEVKKLRKNKFVKNVSNKSITYTDEFKEKVVFETVNYKKFPRQVFEECGFDINVIGIKRTENAAYKWRKQYKNLGELKDNRKNKSGRLLKRELSDAEKLKRAEAKIKLLEAENELLKKKRYDTARNINIRRHSQMETIKKVIEEYQLKGMTKYLCSCLGVSTSGYYNYLKNEEKRQERDEQDKKDFELILKAYKYRNRKKGARQIKLLLQNKFGVNFNLKKIRRLMKKYDLKCPIRKANPYRRMMKATKEHSTCENKVNREFKTGIPYNILLTDITYLFYGDNKKCYLSTIKDAETNEILAYHLSESLELEISLETVKKLKKNRHIVLNENVKIHSDQGVHYTSPQFHKLLKKYNIDQSMSRRGNCWDNAPQESFFGHMKDELNLDICKTFDDVKEEIRDYIDYYNNDRYQWNLKKMTPVLYRNHLFKESA